MILPLWRSLHSVNLMLPKEDRSAMLLRLYNATDPIINHSKVTVPKDNDEPTLIKAETESGDDTKNPVEAKTEKDVDMLDADIEEEGTDMKEEGGVSVDPVPTNGLAE